MSERALDGCEGHIVHFPSGITKSCLMVMQPRASQRSVFLIRLEHRLDGWRLIKESFIILSGALVLGWHSHRSAYTLCLSFDSNQTGVWHESRYTVHGVHVGNSWFHKTQSSAELEAQGALRAPSSWPLPAVHNSQTALLQNSFRPFRLKALCHCGS